MKTTFRLMGVADWITLLNGLLGTFSIACLILAFDDFSTVDAESERYIWMAMFFIILSVFGDLIDGPIARTYSKRRHLGSYLDLMSDSISFGVAPAILVFGLFSQWGQNAPFWTISVVIVCCWVVVCTMLRLARFQHESELDNRWFHGLASPASAVLILALSGLIYLQPEVFDIDSLSSDTGSGTHSPLDWMILPGMAIAGMLMISDRRLPKFSKGMGMNLSLVLLLSMFIATLIPITGLNSNGAITASFFLLAFSLSLIITHVLFGPKICDSMFNNPESEA